MHTSDAPRWAEHPHSLKFLLRAMRGHNGDGLRHIYRTMTTALHAPHDSLRGRDPNAAVVPSVAARMRGGGGVVPVGVRAYDVGGLHIAHSCTLGCRPLVAIPWTGVCAVSAQTAPEISVSADNSPSITI